MGWTPVWEDVLTVFYLVNVAFGCGLAGHEFVTSHNEVLNLMHGLGGCARDLVEPIPGARNFDGIAASATRARTCDEDFARIEELFTCRFAEYGDWREIVGHVRLQKQLREPVSRDVSERVRVGP